MGFFNEFSALPKTWLGGWALRRKNARPPSLPPSQPPSTTIFGDLRIWWAEIVSGKIHQHAAYHALEPLEGVLTALCAVVISFVATLYPAWQAARLAPVEGLRLA